jgi:hypothetical protein
MNIPEANQSFYKKNNYMTYQQKKKSIDDSKKPLFITASKKGVGIQKECIRNQIINNKSCLAKRVLKVSCDNKQKERLELYKQELNKFK